MRIACWVVKATQRRSEYVILYACPLQQWLRERASLRLYVHCLSCKVLTILEFYQLIFEKFSNVNFRATQAIDEGAELFRTKGRRVRHKHDGAKGHISQFLRTCLINGCYFCNLLVFVSEMS